MQAACVKNFVEPRIELEVMFGMKAAPRPSMSDAALLDCVQWVSLGYEIVQSIFPRRRKVDNEGLRHTA
jgi:2-oxo-3-hexenedioate decarboxylase